MVNIEFTQSAFKHKQTKADIRSAIQTKIYDALIDEFKDKYAVIGFNTKLNPIEVLYERIDDDTIKIFHAMPYRNNFLDTLEES
jgi:hypothetical protein